MIRRCLTVSTLLLLALLPAVAASAHLTLALVVPGQPGTTEEAAPTLARWAAHLAGAMGRPEETVRVAYYPEPEEGRASLEGEAGYAMLPLALVLAWEETLGGLTPLALAETERGTHQRWTLVRPRGSARDLSGITVQGTACVDPRFVRRVILDGLPGAAASRPVFVRRTLSALRALPDDATGAVLLSEPEAEALPSLPFAARLATLHRSAPLPDLVVVALDRVGRPPGEREDLRRALLALHRSPEGAAIAADLRLTRFMPPDAEGLARARKLYRGPEEMEGE